MEPNVKGYGIAVSDLSDLDNFERYSLVVEATALMRGSRQQEEELSM